MCVIISSAASLFLYKAFYIAQNAFELKSKCNRFFSFIQVVLILPSFVSRFSIKTYHHICCELLIEMRYCVTLKTPRRKKKKNYVLTIIHFFNSSNLSMYLHLVSGETNQAMPASKKANQHRAKHTVMSVTSTFGTEEFQYV